MSKLMNSWYDLLNGELDDSLPVYIESVPESESGNYVLLRAEGETDVERNNKTWIKECVIICDIVTVFKNMIDTSVADGIYGEVGTLLADGPFKNHNLQAQTSMIINRVMEDGSAYLQEDDGTRKFYRKVIRYNHLVTIQI